MLVHKLLLLLVLQDSTTTVDCPSCSWQPYINTLPIRIPCGWAKSQQQLTTDYDSFLYKHGLGLSWWKYFVAQVCGGLS